MGTARREVAWMLFFEEVKHAHIRRYESNNDSEVVRIKVMDFLVLDFC